MYPSSSAVRRAAGTGLLCALSVAGSAQASGFRIPELSLAGLGTANALVANTKELGALAYNPAAMSYHKGNNVSAGLITITPNLDYTSTTGTYSSHVDTPFYVPNFFAMGEINEDMRWGLAVNVPFGLETNWLPGTFSTLAGPYAGAHLTRSKIEMYNVNPNVSYRLGSNMSVAAGLDYYNVKQVRLSAVAAEITGSGSDFGYNLGMLYKLGPVMVGASYHSGVKVEVDGRYNSTPATANLDFPWTLQIGAHVQISDKLGAEFDYERTGWKNFDKIVVRSLTGTILTTSRNEWEDSDTYRFGFTYDMSKATQLRFGYALDMPGQDKFGFSARVPDNNRHLFGLGVAQKVGNWTVEGGYMYVKFDTYNYIAPAAFGTYGTDANGTSAYNGTYESSVHLLGLGLSTTF